MEKTKPSVYLYRDFLGYYVATKLSAQSQRLIKPLQKHFVDEFGELIYPSSLDFLHISLMDWLSPITDYAADKDELYKKLFEEYDRAILDSIIGISPINVRFNSVEVSPNAVIVIGTDNGQYQAIRERFLKKVNLQPNTKSPPQIIHTTIARFTKESQLLPLKNFAAKQSINFTETVSSFELRRGTNTGLKILKTYQLK